jgi:predicted PurR-regulated permease PerM
MMPDTTRKIPFYIRVSFVFIGIFAFVYIMYIGRQIMVPVVFAAIVAILMNPVVNFMKRHGIGNIASISIATFMCAGIMIGIIMVLGTQLNKLSENYSVLAEKIRISKSHWMSWISSHSKIETSRIDAWIEQTKADAISTMSSGETISGFGRTLIIILLLPVYLFMILYYKPLLLEFIRRLFNSSHHTAVVEILHSVKTIIQQYLSGIFFEMIIVAALNVTGLLFIGLQYAVIIGIAGAVINIIPYLGGVIATVFTMFVAFITKDSASYPVIIFIMYTVILFIDSHYIFPFFVASRVKLNALISLIVVLIGGSLWGIPGMFLSVPVTAIIKVIFDHIDSLKPWGYLLGNNVSGTRKPFKVKAYEEKPGNR